MLVCDELSVSSTVQPSRDETLHGSRLKSDLSLLKRYQDTINYSSIRMNQLTYPLNDFGGK